MVRPIRDFNYPQGADLDDRRAPLHAKRCELIQDHGRVVEFEHVLVGSDPSECAGRLRSQNCLNVGCHCAPFDRALSIDSRSTRSTVSGPARKGFTRMKRLASAGSASINARDTR